MTMRVAIVDDQDLVRTGFRMILEDLPGLEIIGEASDGAQAVRLVESYRPDVTLMDVRMPTMDGVEATRRIVSRDPSARVLILTTFDLDEYAFAGLRAGASGFLLKEVPVNELANAIRIIAAGDAVVAPRVTRLLLDTYAHQFPALRDTGSRATPPGLDRLTLREREVLLLIAGGLSNAEIATRLTVSETTAKSHVASILTKLSLPNRVHTVIYAYENGLVAKRKQKAGPV
jgi:DNA-binding NarL/FixJ family response regulator